MCACTCAHKAVNGTLVNFTSAQVCNCAAINRREKFTAVYSYGELVRWSAISQKWKEKRRRTFRTSEFALQRATPNSAFVIKSEEDNKMEWKSKRRVMDEFTFTEIKFYFPRHYSFFARNKSLHHWTFNKIFVKYFYLYRPHSFPIHRLSNLRWKN